MFGLSMRTAPRVCSWNDAARTLNDATAGKQRSDGSWPIPGKEGSKAVSVRLTKDGIAFRYHYTDVITWHPDGSYTHDPYHTTSTCTFFNSFCPARTYLTRTGEVLIIDKKGYPICGGRPVHVKDGVPQSGTGLFSKTVVNRKEAKKLLAETPYAEYREWYKTMRPLLTESGCLHTPHDDFCTQFEDREWWPALASAMGGLGKPDNVREMIYHENPGRAFEEKKFGVLSANAAQDSRYRVIPAE